MANNTSNNWIQKYFELARLVATWSKDPSTKVGSVIIPANSDVPIIGYNGFARGISDAKERYADRDLKLKMIIHSGANAIFNAQRFGISLIGGTIFATKIPCSECAKAIIQSGIKTVYYLPADDQFNQRWAESIALTETLFTEANIQLILI